MFLQAFYGVKARLVNPDGNDEIDIDTGIQHKLQSDCERPRRGDEEAWTEVAAW